MFTKKDFIIIFIIFVVIIGALLFNHFYFSQKAAYVKITVNNQVYRTVPLEICLPNQVVIAIVSNQYNDVDSSSK